MENGRVISTGVESNVNLLKDLLVSEVMCVIDETSHSLRTAVRMSPKGWFQENSHRLWFQHYQSSVDCAR